MTRLSRRALLTSGVAGAAVLAAPAVARAQPISWRMVTSWARNLPGPGVTAQRLAERIAAMSDGRLTLTLYSAGERVSGPEVLGAVGRFGGQMGHPAPLFWPDQVPAAV